MKKKQTTSQQEQYLAQKAKNSQEEPITSRESKNKPPANRNKSWRKRSITLNFIKSLTTFRAQLSSALAWLPLEHGSHLSTALTLQPNCRRMINGYLSIYRSPTVWLQGHHLTRSL